jgi:transglutaminase-like putative cysteine protease
MSRAATVPLHARVALRLGLTAGQISRDKADTLLLLLACVLVLLPQATHLPLWTSLACAATLGWRAWVTFRGKRMPSPWLLLPIAALGMAGVYWTHHTFFGREPGVAMLVLLLAFKLLEMHAKRDLFVVMFLSFFLILTNFLYSQSIGTALMMIAALIAIVSAQVSFQYTGRVPPLARRLRFGAALFALALPLALVLFVLFPRISGPLWGLPGDAHNNRSGLSDSMSPGNVSSLALSDEIAFRAKFDGSAPRNGQLYWRGPVLGDYDGRTWTVLRHNGRRLAGQPITITMRSPPLHYQVTLEPTGQRWIYALELPKNAPTLEGNPTGFTADLQLLASQPISQRVRYDVQSVSDYQLQANEDIDNLQQWLRLPVGLNQRTTAFAAALRQQYGAPAQQVSAVLQFFRQGKFRYTLEPPLLGKDAVDEFLFTTQAGFCEHYAGAFVVVMRAMGIPARVVTGYQGGEVNPVDGYLTIRQSDAHAWAEVWLKQRGWLRIDPTAAVAPERVEKNLASAIPHRGLDGLFGFDGLNNLISLEAGKDSWLSQIRNNWSAVSNAWNQWVLDYTPSRQRSLIESLGIGHADWRTMILLMTAIGTAVIGLTLLPLLLQRSQRDPLDVIYATWCQSMARHGYRREIYEGPHSYGARLAAALITENSTKQAAIAQFLALYSAAKYARGHHQHDTPNTPTTPDYSRAQQRATMATLKALLVQCR